MVKTLLIPLVALGLLAACGGGPQATPTTALPYTDDFSAKGTWTTQNDISADVKLENGVLRIVVKQENLTVWSLAGKSLDDAVVEVDAKPNGGPEDNGFGILFRVKDRKNFYHFEISSDGYWRAGVMKDGKWDNFDDWAPHPSIRQSSAANRLKVVMKGDSLTFFVNNQQIFQKTDKTFTSGDIGLSALTLIDKPGTDISFDNVSVTKAP